MATSPYENTIQNLELVLSGANLHFVGWVEPTPSFVGFLQRINLHIAGVIAKCETQQLPISELAVFLARSGRSYENRLASRKVDQDVGPIIRGNGAQSSSNPKPLSLWPFFAATSSNRLLYNISRHPDGKVRTGLPACSLWSGLCKRDEA